MRGKATKDSLAGMGSLIRREEIDKALSHINLDKLKYFLIIWVDEDKVLQIASNELTSEETIQLLQHAENITKV